MRKDKSPKQLAKDILYRSSCRVKVGAVITDRKGSIMSWGWNHAGDGYGCHAEAHAIMRANPRRLTGASIYVAGVYAKNDNPVNSCPCDNCATLIEKMGFNEVVYLDREDWKHARLH